jgi:hypothetical protein
MGSYWKRLHYPSRENRIRMSFNQTNTTDWRLVWSAWRTSPASFQDSRLTSRRSQALSSKGGKRKEDRKERRIKKDRLFKCRVQVWSLPLVCVYCVPQEAVTRTGYFSLVQLEEWVCHSPYPLTCEACGSVVVKALWYKPEGRGFETRWGEWFLSIYLILPAALGSVVY